jgi:hypothetical protein
MEFSSLNFKIFYIEEQLKHLAMIFAMGITIDRTDYPTCSLRVTFRGRGIKGVSFTVYPERYDTKEAIDKHVEFRRNELDYAIKKADAISKEGWRMGNYVIDALRKNTLYRKAEPIIERVIFNNPATIVFWSDNTKTVVKAQDEEFDKEKGLAMAIAKKALGNQGNYFEEFKKWL